MITLFCLHFYLDLFFFNRGGVCCRAVDTSNSRSGLEVRGSSWGQIYTYQSSRTDKSVRIGPIQKGYAILQKIWAVICGGVCSRAVNTSNFGSGGPEFKLRLSRCFLRQGIFLHFVSLHPGV